MRSHTYILGLGAALICIFYGLNSEIVLAQATNYVPLVNIPGISDFRDPTQLVNGFIRIVIVAAALLAVIRIIWGGIKYLTTEAVSSRSEAREIIRDALSGLLLVLASVLILQIVNPDILRIKFFSGPGVNTNAQNTGGNGTSQTTSGGNNQQGSSNSGHYPSGGEDFGAGIGGEMPDLTTPAPPTRPPQQFPDTSLVLGSQDVQRFSRGDATLGTQIRNYTAQCTQAGGTVVQNSFEDGSRMYSCNR